MGFIIKKIFRVNATHLAVLMLTTLFLLSACSDANHESEKQSHNIIKQGDRIQFTLGGREFDILEGNFKGGGETGEGQLIQVTLWGLLPDFEGYDKEKNHAEFIGSRQQRGRDARIELYRRADRITVPDMIIRKERLKSLSAISGRQGKYDELRYGLEYYQSHDRREDIYIYRVADAPVMLIKCPSQIILKNMPFPGCTYYWDISSGISYEMRYSMDYLPQWREIWESTKQLLDAE